MTRSRWTAAAISCASLLLSTAALAQTVTGRVVVVHDGDTITVREAARSVRVRLADIDCPELAQVYGVRAKEFTSHLLLDRVVSVETRGLDQYERLIGRVIVDGVDANQAIVKAGMAWAYSRGRGDPALIEAERNARARHEGLWADQSPVPPWTWRRAHPRSGTEAPAQRSLTDVAERVALHDARGPFHGNTQSRVFHRRGCPRYSCKHCDDEFLSVESAIEAGYRPARDCLKE